MSDALSERVACGLIESADDDLGVMHDLYDKKRFNYCLFFGHLALEKLLKALFAKKNPEQPIAPKIHDLLALAKRCDLEMEIERQKQLDVITSFNLVARYEDYKRVFYEKCTREFTTQQMHIIEEIQKWLKRILTEM